MESFIQYAVYLIILVALAIPLGAYIGKVMNGEKVFLSRICGPCELTAGKKCPRRDT